MSCGWQERSLELSWGWSAGTSVRTCSGYTKPLFSTNRMCAGAGHGTGNPYGIAVITGAFLLPLVFLRIYAPPQYLVGILMTGVSAFSRTTSKRGC